jgi:hypothetical protein
LIAGIIIGPGSGLAQALTAFNLVDEGMLLFGLASGTIGRSYHPGK